MSDLQLIDTHCHVHEPQYGFDIPKEVNDANKAGIYALFFVGTGLESSQQAIACAEEYADTYAVIGVHPHEAEDFYKNHAITDFQELVHAPQVIGIGEIGLDYFYEHSNRKLQEKLFREQLAIAQNAELPVVFHVRGSKNDPDDVFDDFWRILADYPGVTHGILHSYTASSKMLEKVLGYGFLIGINGIMTFSKDSDHHKIVEEIPLDSFVLETDAPYLTPSPFRGTINTPKNVELVANYLASTRGESIETIASQTTKNVQNLFKIK